MNLHPRFISRTTKTCASTDRAMAACNLQVTTIVLFVSIFGGGKRSPWYPIFNGAKMTKLNSIIIFTLEHNKIKSFECASWNYLGLNSMTGSFFCYNKGLTSIA